ncbi:MAG: NHL repeat-containing protein, partial [Elusimicrobia bacterium]|nr:NHL repeat-containing protein [Elusimicrobiota bacterium]
TVPPAFAFAADESTFSLTSGVLGFGVIAPTVTVTLSALDPLVAGAGAGLAAFSYVVDGSSAAPAFAAGADSAAVSVLLQAGAHTILLTAADRAGNAAQESLFVAVGDTVPPVTGVAFGAPSVALPDGSTLVAAATKLTLNATDYAQTGVPPAGVARTEYGFAPDALALYTTSFTVPAPDGPKTLYYYSADRAGNVEALKTAAVVLDTTPPSVAFSFPRPDEGGLCRLVQGRLDVRGAVSDLHLASWGVTAGSVLVGSGTENASGTLGLVDGTGLSGPVTLALTSQDLVQNAASTSLQLQTGQPARVLALGGSGLLNKPRGVATGPNRVYVSDTNDGVVRVFDSAGNLLATFGDAKGKDALRLVQPEGLAVDGSGNIYVADAGNKRVVELSASGTQLAEFGAKHDLKRPMAVALLGGKVVVADAQAGELVAFDASGAVASRTELPAATRGHDPDDDPSEPRPVALDADGAGELWVADAKGGRVLRYDASLTLQQTVTGFERPAGVAASPSGACLAVSDDIADRLYTFDARTAAGLAETGAGRGEGHGRGDDGNDDEHGKEPAGVAPTGLLASFGVHGELDARKPLPAQLYVNHVSQLAFTADGTLLAADRNNDLVQGFGLLGAPLIVALGPPEREHHGGYHLDSVGSGSGAVEAVARVGAAEGGSVQHPDGVAVTIPPAAMSKDQDISVAPADTTGADAQARAAALAANSLSPASPPTQFGPEGLQFAQPATVTLPYDPTEVTVSAAEELKVEYWNPTSGAWEPQPSVVDVVAHTVTAQVRHFSL